MIKKVRLPSRRNRFKVYSETKAKLEGHMARAHELLMIDGLTDAEESYIGAKLAATLNALAITELTIDRIQELIGDPPDRPLEKRWFETAESRNLREEFEKLYDQLIAENQ